MRPEAVEPELIPENRPEPDLAPVAQVPDSQTIHPDAHDLPVIRLRRTVFGKELHLPGPAVFVKDLDGLLPFHALGVVEFAEIEGLTLEDAPPDTNALDEAPVVVGLAVLESPCRSQKHAGIISKSRFRLKGVGLHYTNFPVFLRQYPANLSAFAPVLSVILLGKVEIGCERGKLGSPTVAPSTNTE